MIFYNIIYLLTCHDPSNAFLNIDIEYIIEYIFYTFRVWYPINVVNTFIKLRH
jgi:hypothetical protein